MQIRLTPAVKVLLIACFAAFIVQQTADQFFGANLLGWFALVPSSFVIDHRFWQLFTYAFLHADVMHLFLNLLMLVFIGAELEAAWGTRKFLRYYFFCSISGGLVYLLLQAALGRGLQTPMVGASGAIYGLLVAYGILFGERVMLFMMLFPMKAKHFVWVLAAIEFMSTVFSARTGIAGAAHLGGMAAGWLYLWGRATYVVYQQRQKSFGGRPKKKRASHLKLIIDRTTGRHHGESGKDKDQSDRPKTWH